MSHSLAFSLPASILQDAVFCRVLSALRLEEADDAVVSCLQSASLSRGVGSLTETRKLYLGGIKILRGHPRGPLDCNVQPA